MINNILKKIEKANEVQKVELEKHEIELGSVENLQPFVNDKDFYNANIKMTVEKLTRAERDLNDSLRFLTEIKDTISQKNNLALKETEKIELQVKELGINADSIPMYKNAKVVLNENQKTIKNIDNLLKKYNK